MKVMPIPAPKSWAENIVHGFDWFAKSHIATIEKYAIHLYEHGDEVPALITCYRDDGTGFFLPYSGDEYPHKSDFYQALADKMQEEKITRVVFFGEAWAVEVHKDDEEKLENLKNHVEFFSIETHPDQKEVLTIEIMDKDHHLTRSYDLKRDDDYTEITLRHSRVDKLAKGEAVLSRLANIFKDSI